MTRHEATPIPPSTRPPFPEMTFDPISTLQINDKLMAMVLGAGDVDRLDLPRRAGRNTQLPMRLRFQLTSALAFPNQRDTIV